jgi:hypothetical protein
VPRSIRAAVHSGCGPPGLIVGLPCCQARHPVRQPHPRTSRLVR